MKKGFTLIELVAVILILGFIALIATPIVINVVEDSKKEVVLNSAKLYVNQVNNKLMELKVSSLDKDKNVEPISDGSYSIMPDGKLCVGELNIFLTCSGTQLVDFELDNIIPECGTLYISNNKVLSLENVQFDNYVLNSIDNNNYQAEQKYICQKPTNQACFKVEEGVVSRSNKSCSNVLIMPPLINNETPTEIKRIGFSSLGLTNVAVPSNIKKIGHSSFSNNEITSLTLSEGLEEIGPYAFYDSKMELELKIPASVKLIDEYAFAGRGSSNKISKVTFTEGSLLQEIGSHAFSGNPISGELKIPSTVQTIGSYAFARNSYHNDVVILSFEKTSQLETIGARAFFDVKLKSDEILEIPASVTTIGASAFECDNNACSLSKLVFEEGENTESRNLIISKSAFYKRGIETLILPEGLISIGETAFYNNKIDELEIPSTVTSIETKAFGENNLKKVTINIYEDEKDKINIASDAFKWFNSAYCKSDDIKENPCIEWKKR